MSASQKLSKQVAQELRRHVKRPRKNGAANAGAPTKSAQNGGSGSGNGGARASGGGGHGKTLAGCVAFVGVTASMPIIAMQWIGSLNDREEVSLSSSNAVSMFGLCVVYVLCLCV